MTSFTKRLNLSPPPLKWLAAGFGKPAKCLLFVSATVPASLLAGVVLAEPDLAIAVQTCAGSATEGQVPYCGDNQDQKQHFRELQLSTIGKINENINKSPNDASLFTRKGFILSELGDVVQALASYDRAVGLNPKNAQAYFDRGNLRFKMGDTNLALQDYAQALKLNPESYGQKLVTA
jgi:tetratricopeptide (TPR) repeat protein